MKTYLREIADRPLVLPALLFSVSLFFGLWIAGYQVGNRNTGNIISVTGSASQKVMADSASWTIALTRTTVEKDIPTANASLEADGLLLADFLTNKKYASSTVSRSIITSSPNYSANGGAPISFSVSQRVTLSTTEVEKIDALSHELSSSLISLSAGTVLSPESPAYYISTLPELRVSLAGKAVLDAKARATEIARNGGSTVGALSSASSGVVQVLPPDSTNVDDYGSYDTSTIQKQVMVTARASFYVK